MLACWMVGAKDQNNFDQTCVSVITLVGGPHFMISLASVDRRRLSSIANPVTNIFRSGGHPNFLYTGCEKCCVKFWSVLDDPLTLMAHVCVV